MARCVSFLTAWCTCVFGRLCRTPCVSIAGLVARGGLCKYYLQSTKQKTKCEENRQKDDTPSDGFHAGDWSNPRARIVASAIILNSFQAVVPPVLKLATVIHVYCAHHHWSTALLCSEAVSTNELLMYLFDVLLLSLHLCKAKIIANK